MDHAEVVQQAKEAGKSIVTTNGVFDLFHFGHLLTLTEAKKQGDILIVGVNSDSSIKEYKSEHRPLNSEKDRLAIIDKFSY